MKKEQLQPISEQVEKIKDFAKSQLLNNDNFIIYIDNEIKKINSTIATREQDTIKFLNEIAKQEKVNNFFCVDLWEQLQLIEKLRIKKSFDDEKLKKYNELRQAENPTQKELNHLNALKTLKDFLIARAEHLSNYILIKLLLLIGENVATFRDITDIQKTIYNPDQDYYYYNQPQEQLTEMLKSNNILRFYSYSDFNWLTFKIDIKRAFLTADYTKSDTTKRIYLEHEQSINIKEYNTDKDINIFKKSFNESKERFQKWCNDWEQVYFLTSDLTTETIKKAIKNNIKVIEIENKLKTKIKALETKADQEAQQYKNIF